MLQKVMPSFCFPLLPQLDFWLSLWRAHDLHLSSSSTYWAPNLLLNSLLTMAMSHKILSILCGSFSVLYLFTDKVKCNVTKPKSLGVPPWFSALLCALLWLSPSSSLDMQAICGTFSILLLFHLHSYIMPKYCHLCTSKTRKCSAA